MEKTIPDDAPFCPYCGKHQYEQQTAQPTQEPVPEPTHQPEPYPQQTYQPEPYPQQPQQEPYVSLRSLPVLRKERYNTLLKKRLVVGIVLFSIMLAFSVIFSIIEFVYSNFFLGIIILVISAMSIISIISNSKSIKAVNRTELNVTNEGLYGCGSNEKYTSSIPFELPYSRIVKVSSLPKHLVITTRESAYYLLVNDPPAVEAYIDNVMKTYHHQ